MSFLAAANLKIGKFKKISFIRFVIYAFISWVIFRACFSINTPSLNTIRDFAPYAYFIYLFPLKKLWSNIETYQRIKIERWLINAFVFHFIWISVSYILSFTSMNFPYISESQQIRIFTIRPDFDAVIMSITAYFAATKKISNNQVITSSLIIICTLFVVSQGNRSSFISFAVILFLFIIKKISKSESIERSLLMILVSAIILCLATILVSNTQVGKKFSGTLWVFNSQTEIVSNIDGFGTANARIQSWRLVLTYMNENPSRQLVGVGFGKDFMTESGALRALVASEQGSRALPRQPHNYALNTYARLGIIGFIFFFVAFSRLLIESFRIIHTHTSTLACIGSLLFITLLPISLLGVVGESPFGAITTIFAVSVILEKLESYGKK